MKKRILLWLPMLVLTLVVAAGCSKNANKNSEDDDALYLYYINADENGFYPVKYEPSETETIKIAKELIHEMSDSTNIHTDSYKLAITEDISVNTVTLEKKIVTVDFETSYQQLTPEKEILCRGAVVKTLMQIDDIDGVRFTVDGASLTSGTVTVGVMTDDSFLDSEDEIYSSEAEVSLYYANENGDKLVEIVKTVTAKDNISLEQAALEALKDVPEGEDVTAPIPTDLTIQKVQIYDNICYISLSNEIVSSMTAVSDEVMVYSMVNTIIGMGNVNSVQFTINGQKVKTLHEYSNFDKIHTYNYTVCEYND